MTRPVYLNLFTLSYPVTAVVSICHRVAGVVLALGIFYLLFLLDLSLSSEAGFQAVKGMFAEPIHGFALWLISVALIYHLIAGIRHLFLDLHVGDRLTSARVSGYFVLGASMVGALAVAYWLW